MTIKQLGINKEATVLLGAGASRGASPFHDAMVPAPLDTDFFQLMEMIRHREPELGVFLKSVRDEIGNGSYPRMEEWFSRIERAVSTI